MSNTDTTDLPVAPYRLMPHAHRWMPLAQRSAFGRVVEQVDACVCGNVRHGVESGWAPKLQTRYEEEIRKRAALEENNDEH